MIPAKLNSISDILKTLILTTSFVFPCALYAAENNPNLSANALDKLNQLDAEQQQRQQQQAENRAEQLDKSATVRFENNAEKPLSLPTNETPLLSDSTYLTD